jgi:uncharacterized membrane protein
VTTPLAIAPRSSAPVSSSRPALVRRRIAGAWIALSSLAIVAISIGTYSSGTVAALAEDEVGLAPHYSALPVFFQVVLYIHIGAASLALLLGPLQFATALRARFTRVHRWTGRVYLAAVLIAGIAGLVIAPVNEAGFVGFFGFGTLAVVWIVSAVNAYRTARTRDFRSHQAWMMRNFAMTYAAVTLRLWLGVLVLVHLAFGLEGSQAFTNAYAAVPFLAWLPNIVIAEIMIARRGLPGLRWSGAGRTAR